ncbi:hypothetical protein Tco_0006698 [Tanacetum coccineum]
MNQNINNLVFRSFFEKEKLTGPKFIDWYCNLRIVLTAEDKLTFLEQPIPATHVPHEGQDPKKGQNKKPQKAAKGKSKGNGKSKLAYAPAYVPKPKIPPLPKKDSPANDTICHQCDEVYDTVSSTHICNETQGLRGSKKLKLGALNMYMGNGHHVAAHHTHPLVYPRPHPPTKRSPLQPPFWGNGLEAEA